MMSSRRAALVPLVALAVCAFMLTRGFDDLERIRVKVVEAATQPSDGSIRLETSRLSDIARVNQPLALILRTRNTAANDRAFTVSVDGTRACGYTIAANESRRTDCVAHLASGTATHVVEVAGPPWSWTLEYLELSTHHGNTSGMNYLVILPRDSTLGTRPSALFLGVVGFGVLAVILLIPASRFPQWAGRTHTALSGLILIVALLIQVAPWLTSFRIVVSAWTVVLWLLIVGARQVATAARWLAGDRDRPASIAGTLARAAVVAACVLTIFWQPVRDRLQEYDGNYSGFVMISERAFNVNPLVKDRDDLRSRLRLLRNGGYDGQFMYFAAFDPFMRAFRDQPRQYRDVVDAVPYRFGRIGYSALVRAVSLGHPEHFPATMVWVGLLALAAAAFALSLIAQAQGRTALLGGLIILVPGFWQSLQSALPEPLAAATLLGGVLCLLYERTLPAAVLFAASLLVRETGVVLVLCMAAGLLGRGQRKQAIVLGIIAVTPMILWRVYVGVTIYPDWGLRGFFDHPADLTVPFSGFIDLWRVIFTGVYADGTAAMARAGATFPIVLIAAFAAALALVVARRSPINVGAVCYALLAVSLNYGMIWVHVGNGQRGTFELFVALALATASMGRDYPRYARACVVVLWVVSAGYIFFGAFDAEFTRAALAWPT